MERLTIESQIEFRVHKREYAEELFRLTDRNRSYLKKWLPWLDGVKTTQNSAEWIEKCIAQAETNDGLQGGIWQAESLIGCLGMHAIDWNNRSSSLGYWLGENFAGRGIVTKACRTLVTYMFSEMNLNRIELSIATSNVRSQKIARRLGFKEEGTLRQREWLYDHYVDHVLYSCLKSEWKMNDHR